MGAHGDISGAAGIANAIYGVRNETGDLHNKIEYSLQLSICQVTYRSNDFTTFKIKYGEIEYSATLFFNPKFYALNGYPKLNEYVVVIHNNGNNAHIMYSANPKDISDPPFGGSSSKKVGIFSSAKCSL